MIISVIGPSGSGKDTQVNLLMDKLKIPNISTGDILRQEIKKKTELATKLEEILAEGKWVPDEIVYDLLLKRVQESDCANGFIGNGFPRTEGQVSILDKVCEKKGEDLKCVIHFSLSREEVLSRLEKQAGENTNRNDTSKEAMLARLDSYNNTIKPILDLYRERGILADMDASGTIEDIHKDILNVLEIK